MAGAAGVLVVTGDGEKAPPHPVTTGPGGSGEPDGRRGEPKGTDGGAEETEGQHRVKRVVRSYVAAINDGDGRAVCELVPSVTDELDLPRQRGGCAPSVRASIGYADPRGFPVWRRSRLQRIASVEVDGSAARVVATVVTYFADRDEPSIEDDVLYLEGRGGRWRLAKPSSTLYRAIGVPDVPLEVLEEP